MNVRGKISREVNETVQALLLSLILGLPLATAHYLGAIAGERELLTDRVAVEAGILLAAPYVGLRLASGFLSALLFFLNVLLRELPGVKLDERPNSEVKLGTVLAAFALIYGFAAVVAALLMAFFASGGTAVGWALSGGVLLVVWFIWLTRPWRRGMILLRLFQAEKLIMRGNLPFDVPVSLTHQS